MDKLYTVLAIRTKIEDEIKEKNYKIKEYSVEKGLDVSIILYSLNCVINALMTILEDEE